MTAEDLQAFLESLSFGPGPLVRLSGRPLTPEPADYWPQAISAVEKSLASLVYWNFYNACAEPSSATAGTQPDYAAQCPVDYPPDPGWTVVEVHEAHTVVRKGVRLRAIPLDNVADGDIVAGRTVSIKRQVVPPVPQTGFFHVNGRSLAGDFDRQHTTRFYLNVEAEAAAAALGTIVKTLNAFEVPFLYKSLVRWPRRRRSDAAVLYTPRRSFDLVSRLVTKAGIRCGRDVPRFTLRLSDGIGVAEDPLGGVSFGQKIALLVARGALLSPNRRLCGVRMAFAAAGLRWEEPWLNPGSISLPKILVDVR